MKCKYCHKKVDNDAVFCPYCGKELPKRELFMPIIIILLIVILGIMIYFLFFVRGENIKNVANEEQQEEQIVKEDPLPVDSDSISTAKIVVQQKVVEDSVVKVVKPEKKVSQSVQKVVKDLGYGTYKGKLLSGKPHDVKGRLVFKYSHQIDSRDPKGRVADPGDYVVGEFYEGHLVQGVWYDVDNQVKGSILIGR